MESHQTVALTAAEFLDYRDRVVIPDLTQAQHSDQEKEKESSPGMGRPNLVVTPDSCSD